MTTNGTPKDLEMIKVVYAAFAEKVAAGRTLLGRPLTMAISESRVVAPNQGDYREIRSFPRQRRRICAKEKALMATGHGFS